MATQPLIYLDNAATTFPKPRSVLESALDVYLRMGASPGRGSYDAAVEMEERVSTIREHVARFFGAPDGYATVFGYNATDALNTLLQGMAEPGSHIVGSRLEHNSVLRPLNHLRLRGIIDYTLVPFDGDGYVDPDDVARAIRPETRLVILNGASNVLGTVQPLQEVGAVCRERGVPLAVDAAQLAGAFPVNMKEWNVSALAFTGHKCLLATTGIGGLVFDPSLPIQPVRYGGTGMDSHSLLQTMDFPFRLEAGTINVLGILSLDGGIDYITERGLETMRNEEMALAARMWNGLADIPKVKLYGSFHAARRLPLVAANIEGMNPSDVGAILDGDFTIATRVGLHCAPLLHEDIGTGKTGAVRFSPGPFNTAEEIDRAVEAMATISRSA